MHKGSFIADSSRKNDRNSSAKKGFDHQTYGFVRTCRVKKIQWIIIIVPIQMVIWRVHPADSRSFDVFFVFMIFVNNDYGSLSANTYLPELVVL